MRKSYTYGIPFGQHRESGRLLEITEVERGISCNCLCPGCRTALVAKQGEVKLWHFSHSTELSGDCDGLMMAIRARIIEIIKDRLELGFPHLLEGYEGGTVPLGDVKENLSMFGATADLVVTVNQLTIAIFLDMDRSIASHLTFDHLHHSEQVAALRIDLPDIEYEIGRVQRGERKCSYSECIEQILIDETDSREWLYHPMLHQLEGQEIKQYHGRQPAEAGPLHQRMADHGMFIPDVIPESMNAIHVLRQQTVVCLCRLTVKGADIAQTDEFTLFLRYFRQHCLENSDTVSYEVLMHWIDMIANTGEGKTLTQDEHEYLNELARIGNFNVRLKAAFLGAGNVSGGVSSHESEEQADSDENYPLF